MQAQPHAILIDDDPLVRMTWEHAAQQVGKSLVCFASAEAFEAVATDFPIEVAVFIDSNLGNGVRGEDLAKRLFDRGFKRLYLVTGYDPGQFKPMPWILAILDKMPPKWAFSGGAP